MGIYINKTELLKELSVIQDRPVHSAMQIIKILPTIDLIRCEECKYIYTDEGVTLCGVWGKYTFKDGFCYQGERNANEEY